MSKSLHLGSTYPMTDLGTDPGVLRTYAQGLEDLGFDEIYVSDHVLGVGLAAHKDWAPYNPTTRKATGPLYDYTFSFLEPLVTFGFLAGVTKRLRLGSSVLVLGMRQAVLVAKQAAMADVLSGGRVILGIGSGWNDLEIPRHGRRLPQPGIAGGRAKGGHARAVDPGLGDLFEGRWHSIPTAGINPLPVQRPIPIWIGGTSDKAVMRAARLADGWYPGDLLEPGAPGELYLLSAWGTQALELFRTTAAGVGRDPDAIALTGAVNVGPRSAEQAADEITGWARIGATHVNIRTSRYPATWADYDTGKVARTDVERHLDLLASIAACWRAR